MGLCEMQKPENRGHLGMMPQTGKGFFMGRMKTMLGQENKDLKVLADDFGLLHRADVQEIIETCRNYDEGQKELMKIYTIAYM